MARIVIDKPNKQVIFKCKNKEDMKLVLDRYIEGCKSHVEEIQNKLNAEESRDAFVEDSRERGED